MPKSYLYLLFIACIGYNLSFSQQKANILTPEIFIDQVKAFHPVAKQANLIVSLAEAELLATRGAFFDPTFNFDASRKTFDGKNYYFYNNPEIKVPTIIGVDVKAGLENNGGNNIFNETTTGQSSYLGVEMPLARGLLMDKRRAALQQAKLYRTQSEQERLIVINNLLLDAYNAYWQWAGGYQLYSIYSKFLSISQDRLRLVKLAYNNGDRAEIDTIEALTQVQSFAVMQQEAKMRLINAGLELSNFLWLQNDTAYQLPATTIPDTAQFIQLKPTESVESYVMLSAAQNPMLKTYDFKLQALEVERRLKFQSFLPYVNVKANMLNKGYNVVKGVDVAFLENNYKWGLDIKMPLFLREGRGDYRKAKLKIEQTNYELSNKRWETENKIRFYYTEINQLQQQIITMQNAYFNYQKLLKAEDLRFKNGESSLFILNTRENKVIESMQKIIELRIKYFKANYSLQWATGALR